MDKMSLGGVSPAAFEQASSLKQNLFTGMGSVHFIPLIIHSESYADFTDPQRTILNCPKPGVSLFVEKERSILLRCCLQRSRVALPRGHGSITSQTAFAPVITSRY